MNLHTLLLEAFTQGFQFAGEGGVVKRLAVRRRFQQRHVDDARTLVEGHQLADLVGAFDVALERFEAREAAVVAVGDHRAAFQALLGHPGPAG
ncbi:hypothetical protein D3C78_879270 [compost metagenome]